jgi:hypothetical protein
MKSSLYTQVTSKCSFQRELSGFQTRHRFEDLVVLNQESVTQYESQLNSPLGAPSRKKPDWAGQENTL